MLVVAFAVAFLQDCLLANHAGHAAAPVDDPEDEDYMPNDDEEEGGGGRALRQRAGSRRSLGGDDEPGPSQKRGRRGAATAVPKAEPAGGCWLDSRALSTAPRTRNRGRPCSMRACCLRACTAQAGQPTCRQPPACCLLRR